MRAGAALDPFVVASIVYQYWLIKIKIFNVQDGKFYDQKQGTRIWSWKNQNEQIKKEKI